MWLILGPLPRYDRAKISDKPDVTAQSGILGAQLTLFANGQRGVDVVIPSKLQKGDVLHASFLNDQGEVYKTPFQMRVFEDNFKDNYAYCLENSFKGNPKIVPPFVKTNVRDL